MILIVGDVGDTGLAYVVHRMIERDIPFRLIDPTGLQQDFSFTWALEDGRLGGQIELAGEVLPLDAVGAALIGYTSQHPTEADLGFLAALDEAPFFVCNRLSASASNFSKLYQQQLIARHGFLVPKTMVSNVPEQVREFYKECHQRIIYKSISSWRSTVRRFTSSDLERLPLVENCPTQFQEWIPGTDIRVHVVQDAVFATEIQSNAVDYRFSHQDGMARRMRAVELPEVVAERCVTLAKKLRLSFAGIDLRRHISGDYYCFEANPTPGFAFFQHGTGQRIGDSVVEMLRTEAIRFGSRPITEV